MKHREPAKDPRIVHFWIQYTDTLKLFRIPEQTIPWYRKHIQSFIDDHPDTRLREHSVETVETWLGELGRNPYIGKWQFRQRVDALRLLFCHFMNLSWSAGIEWDLWSSGAKSPGKAHPMVARTHKKVEKVVQNPKKPMRE